MLRALEPNSVSKPLLRSPLLGHFRLLRRSAIRTDFQPNKELLCAFCRVPHPQRPITRLSLSKSFALSKCFALSESSALGFRPQTLQYRLDILAVPAHGTDKFLHLRLLCHYLSAGALLAEHFGALEAVRKPLVREARLQNLLRSAQSPRSVSDVCHYGRRR